MKTTFRYGEEDLAGAKSLVDQCPSDDPDTDINLGEREENYKFCLDNKVLCVASMSALQGRKVQ